MPKRVLLYPCIECKPKNKRNVGMVEATAQAPPVKVGIECLIGNTRCACTQLHRVFCMHHQGEKSSEEEEEIAHQNQAEKEG